MRDAFERVLQTKRQPPRADDEDATLVNAPPMLAWVSTPLVRTPDTVPAPAGAVAEVATGTRAAIETALQNSVPHDLCPIGGTDRPSVWEASIGGASGPVELRAERVAVQGTQPTWGLTIGAPALGADVVARHAPRLHDRLRKHGIDVDHVRIERDADDRAN
ncbi:MAG TPA: hypothetical protein VFU71_18345 [Burkholderiaceae bacterium]|nr:hypothetical protein [Burkholderiaceae bacterium]